MLSLNGTKRFAILLTLIMQPALLVPKPCCAQSTKPPLQPLQLPDPTPRQQDPHGVFHNDPASGTRQQQAESAERYQVRQQLIADAGEIYLLAERLQKRILQGAAGAPEEPGVMLAQRIEKLAKHVKDQSRGR